MRPRSDRELISGGVIGGLVLLVYCLAEPIGRAVVAAPDLRPSATRQTLPPSVVAQGRSEPTPRVRGEDAVSESIPQDQRSGLPISPLPTPPLAATPGLEKSQPPSPAALVAMDLLFPVPSASSSTVPDSFDDRRGARIHHAMDILAPRHSEVVAVADGTIARLMTSVAGGIAVYQFSADQRYSFYYAHLQGYANGLAEGQKVKRGQVLGYVGTTGNAPPNTPHLHFSISQVDRPNQWSGGVPLNPYPLWR